EQETVTILIDRDHPEIFGVSEYTVAHFSCWISGTFVFSPRAAVTRLTRWALNSPSHGRINCFISTGSSARRHASLSAGSTTNGMRFFSLWISSNCSFALVVMIEKVG